MEINFDIFLVVLVIGWGWEGVYYYSHMFIDIDIDIRVQVWNDGNLNDDDGMIVMVIFGVVMNLFLYSGLDFICFG